MRKAVNRHNKREKHEPVNMEPPEAVESQSPQPPEIATPESADPEGKYRLYTDIQAEPSEEKGARRKPAKLPIWDFLEDDARNGVGTHTIVYRLEPVINRRHNEHFIAKKNGRLNREDMLAEFGSGVYELYVKDVNRKVLYKEPVPFHHHAFPPKVNLAELVAGDPANEVYLKTWGKKSAEGNTDKAPVAASELDGILRTVLEKAGSFDPALAELWKTTANQRDELSKLLSKQNAPPDFAGQMKALKEV